MRWKIFGTGKIKTGKTNQNKKGSHGVLISWPIVDAAKPVLGFLEGCPLVCAMLGILDEQSEFVDNLDDRSHMSVRG